MWLIEKIDMWLIEKNTSEPFELPEKEVYCSSLKSAVEMLQKIYRFRNDDHLTMRIRFVHKLSGKAQGCNRICVDDGSCSVMRITLKTGKIIKLREIGFSHHHLWSMPDKLYYAENKTN